MDKNLYYQVGKNWEYLHPVTKGLAFLDYQFERLIRELMNKERFLYWSPRVLAIAYIFFLGIFALDVFIPDQTLGYYLVALFMHLIPNFVLLVLLVIAWKYEKAGASFFSIAFMTMFIAFWDRSFVWSQFLLFSPLLLISFLLYMHSKYLRR